MVAGRGRGYDGLVANRIQHGPLAGLQEVPEDLYDAAKVDGAGPWSLFWNITIPGIRATLLFVSATTIIAASGVWASLCHDRWWPI